MLDSPGAVDVRGIKAAGGTDPGRVRTTNEDQLYVDVDRGIFLVADGVGGHAAGEVAARIAVDVAVQRLERRAGAPSQRVREAIALANNEIFKQSKHSPQHAGMTCVLTLAVLADGRMTIGHVGDSRLYKLTSLGIAKITHDHSPIGEREDAHEISEHEAMNHPRRNEVFRDVGSAFHEPDEENFIETIEIGFDADAAVVICSDGLSDMVPSAMIDHLVRRYAGDPASVVKALIDAANGAGGKDNITVVYVEGASFASDANGGRAGLRSNPTANVDTDDLERAREPDATADLPDLADLWASARRALTRRTTWLAIGVLLGLSAAITLSLTPPFDRFVSGRTRTIVAGGTASGRVTSIHEAVRNASAGDVVQVEPGEYTERIELKDGVDLIARVPGTVTLLAPSGYMGWVAVVIDGDGSRVSGIRVRGRPTAPMTVGIRVGGHDSIIDDVLIEGDVAVGVEIVNQGPSLVRSNRFEDVKGLPLRLGALSRPIIRQNLFIRNSASDQARALEIAAGAAPQLVGNLFVGYRTAISGPAQPADAIPRQNYSIRDPDHGRER